jgi:hypothetical protein
MENKNTLEKTLEKIETVMPESVVDNKKFCTHCENDVDLEYFRVKKRKYKNKIYNYLNFICKYCEKLYNQKFIK